jgi:hypothetical protein
MNHDTLQNRQIEAERRQPDPLPSGNEDVDTLWCLEQDGEINFTTDFAMIPHPWLRMLRTRRGGFHWVAAVTLAEIVYRYRATPRADNEGVLQLEKRFRPDAYCLNRAEMARRILFEVAALDDWLNARTVGARRPHRMAVPRSVETVGGPSA